MRRAALVTALCAAATLTACGSTDTLERRMAEHVGARSCERPGAAIDVYTCVFGSERSERAACYLMIPPNPNSDERFRAVRAYGGICHND